MHVSFLPPNMSLPSPPYGKIASASLPPEEAYPAHRDGFELLSQPTYSSQGSLLESLFPETSEDPRVLPAPRPVAWRQRDESMYCTSLRPKRKSLALKGMRTSVSSWEQMEEIECLLWVFFLFFFGEEKNE